MADSNASLAGQDATPPPSWDVNQYKDWDAMDKVVGDLTHNGGAWADLTHNAAAERWYVLEDKLGKAISALGTANAAFQKEVSGLKGQFVGVADQAFQDLSSKVYKQSEDVYNTMNRGYATTVGNIGHDIQSFAQHWWDLVREAHSAEDQIRSIYQSIVDNAKDADTVNKAVEGMKQGFKEAEETLYGKLREQLAGLRNRYELRGGDLSPLHVEVPFGQPGTEGGPYTPRTEQVHGPPPYSSDVPPAYAPTSDLPAGYPSSDVPAGYDTSSSVSPGGAGAPADPTAGAPGAGTSAPSGSGGGGSDPGAEAARQKGLQDAKNAADGAIGALQSPSSGAGGGSPDTGGGSSPGSGMGSSPDSGMGSSPGSGLGSSPGSGGGGSPDTGGGGSSGSGAGGDPGAGARQKALDDAKKAADGAIGALQSPSGLGGSPGSGTGGGSGSGDPGMGGGSGSGGPGSGAPMDPARAQGLQAAKDAANKAIDALRKPDDSPERQKALQDAKDAAGKAIDDLAAQEGLDPGSATGGGAGSPENEKALQDAKDAADKAIDGLAHPPTESGDPKASSPEAQKALQDAKDAADKAIDGLKGGEGASLSDFLKGSGKPGDPAMGKAEHDAQAALDKAIESLPGYNGNDAYAQALHQAKDAADKAIQALPDYASVEETPGLTDGHEPIDHPSLPSFGSGGAGGGGIGAGSSLPGVSGGPDARLDTDVAQNEGLHPVGPDGAQARAVAGGPAMVAPGAAGNPGMPMYPPGMGGMGGMGAMGGQKREREPNTWLQAEQGTWRDDKDDDEPPSVLGRA